MIKTQFINGNLQTTKSREASGNNPKLNRVAYGVNIPNKPIKILNGAIDYNTSNVVLSCKQINIFTGKKVAVNDASSIKPITGGFRNERKGLGTSKQFPNNLEIKPNVSNFFNKSVKNPSFV